MSTTTVSSPLDANLAALGARHAALVERLRAVEPAGDVVVEDTDQDAPAVIAGGRPLCSRRRPREEADRLADDVDLASHAVIVVLGFGAGHHVASLVRRARGSALVVVYEPDLALLRAVLERVDHASWLRDALVSFVVDDTTAALATALGGAESALVQGTTLVEHPPSRARLGDRAATFNANLAEIVRAARTTMSTTLVRASDTVRNLLRNIDHYAAGPSLHEIAGTMAGAPAVVVSAGPSFERNIEHLRAARDRVVIVATQTTLRPLLERGIAPHFVTALDHHEISARFYEGLTARDVEGITLVADPKAHPVILDAFPGAVRCCRSPVLDRLLGDAARPMGDVPPGATVAHLAFSVSRYLGCDPVILIGQDLAFTDGLYYAPGNPIHDVWAPELGPFNTVAMMEWQRIVRHRPHLLRVPGTDGRELLSDTQLVTYLRQFERLIQIDGGTVINATEGGAAIDGSTVTTLGDALAAYATDDRPDIPGARPELDANRIAVARDRAAHMRERTEHLGAAAREATTLLHTIRDATGKAVDRAFDRLDALRAEVDELGDAMSLLEPLNQLGVYRRVVADRRIAQIDASDTRAMRSAELDRDLDNVGWIEAATAEMVAGLDDARIVLDGRMPERIAPAAPHRRTATRSQIAAVVAVDPDEGGLGRPRSLASPFGDTNVLDATLRRLGAAETIETIILVAPRTFDVDTLVARDAVAARLVVEHADGPFDASRDAITAARRWAPTSWRGGIAGMSVFDEAIAPAALHRVMLMHGLTAALVVGPDWPLLDTAACDEIVRRHLEQPAVHRLVFSQLPPGLAGCVVAAPLAAELAQRDRLATIGARLVWQPHMPQADPIARDANVQVDPDTRRAIVRVVADDDAAANRLAAIDAAESHAIVKTLESDEPTLTDVSIELTTRRTSHGRFRADRATRVDADAACVCRFLGELPPSTRVSFDGDGDPLCHDGFDDVVRHAIERGLAVHVRTELAAPVDVVDRLAALAVDVVSVDLNADRPATYVAMMGHDAYEQVVTNIERLAAARRHLAGPRGAAALALPWIVPRIERCAATLDDIEPFFDRWQRTLGTAVIDDGPDDGDIIPTRDPHRVASSKRRSTLVVRSDGAACLLPRDGETPRIIGRIDEDDVSTLRTRVIEETAP